MPNQGVMVMPAPQTGLDPSQLAPAAAAALKGTPFAPALGTPGAAGPYDDDKKLLDLFEEFREECFLDKWTHERTWWRNILYFMGRQWIYYDKTKGVWQDKRMAKWIPRPITNKMRETAEAIFSVFQSVELSANCRPEGNDPKNVRTAETANQIEPSIAAEHQMSRKELIHDFWLVLTGNAFRQVWWDKRGDSGTVVVPFEKCLNCGTVSSPEQIVNNNNLCPACGTPAQTEIATDDSGAPMQQTITFGKGCTDIPSPFEMGFPTGYAEFEDLPYIIRKRWRDKRWCERMLPPEVVAKLQWEKVSTDRGMQLLRTIQTLNETSPAAAIQATQDTKTEGLTEFEVWCKPRPDFPDGLFLRILGEGSTGQVYRQPAEGVPGPLPYKTNKGKPLFPFTHTPYTKVGGRIWGIGPIDPLIQKQDQLNQIDSMIQLIVQRMSNPVWLEPKGAEVKKFSGEPGIVLKYNPLLANNAKPERVEGSNVPNSMIELRQMYIQDIEALSGTYDVIKGAKPSGVEAFSALQLLVERSQSRYGPVLKARGESYSQWFQIALELERAYGPVTRTWAALGPNSKWSFMEFKNADLQGNISVLVEDGSQTPKTSLGKRAAIEQLAQLQAIQVANPDTAYRVLQVFGQSDLWPGLDADVKSALQEQDDWERWAQQVQFLPPDHPYEVDPMTGQPSIDQQSGQLIPAAPKPSIPPPGQAEVWHNPTVHLAEHKKWANGDTVRTILQMRPELKPYVTWMIQQHDMQIQQAQMQQAMMAQGMPTGPSAAPMMPAPGPAPGGGGMAMQNSNTESGAPVDVPSGSNETPNANQGPQ